MMNRKNKIIIVFLIGVALLLFGFLYLKSSSNKIDFKSREHEQIDSKMKDKLIYKFRNRKILKMGEPDYVGKPLSLDGNVLLLETYDVKSLAPNIEITADLSRKDFVKNLDKETRNKLKEKFSQSTKKKIQILLNPESDIFDLNIDAKKIKKIDKSFLSQANVVSVWVYDSLESDQADISAKVVVVNSFKK